MSTLNTDVQIKYTWDYEKFIKPNALQSLYRSLDLYGQ